MTRYSSQKIRPKINAMTTPQGSRPRLESAFFFFDPAGLNLAMKYLWVALGGF
jgi:hypothetical protein